MKMFLFGGIKLFLLCMLLKKKKNPIFSYTVIIGKIEDGF